MTVISHALISLTLANLMNLHGRDLFTATVFGNLIDVDHLVMWKKYGIYEISETGKKQPRGRAHTLIHEPVFAAPVAAAAWFMGSAVPLAFWGVHVLTDHVFLRSEKRPFWPMNKNWLSYGMLNLGTRAEWVIDAVLLVILGWVWWWGM